MELQLIALVLNANLGSLRCGVAQVFHGLAVGIAGAGVLGNHIWTVVLQVLAALVVVQQLQLGIQLHERQVLQSYLNYQKSGMKQN